MSDTTYEEARRCPKCDDPCAEVQTIPQRDGSKQIVVSCVNNRCRWENENRIILVNKDGSIPPPITKRDKAFPTRKGPTQEQVVERLRKQVNLETNGGAEVSPRY